MNSKDYLFSLLICFMIFIFSFWIFSSVPDYQFPVSQYNFPSFESGWPMD